MTIPDVLQLQSVGDHLYQGPFEPREGGARDVVFGGQLLSQMIMASSLEHDATKTVKSIHAVFSRPATYSEPLAYDVDTVQDGRTFATDTVTCRQHGKVMARSLILLNADEPDLIRHSMVTMPDVPGPDERADGSDGRVFPGAVMCSVSSADDGSSREPVQYIWTRFPPGSDSAAVNQAVLAWATDGYLIGTAMLPHEGFGEDIAHRSISTGVVSHTINFHEPFDSAQWLLMVNEGVWTGRGRAYGRCNIFSREGTLVANYTQDAIVRHMDATPAAGRSSTQQL